MIIVLGGGVCGLATALLLARDGHEVTLPERDGAALLASVEDAWERWMRHGVSQFHQAHFLQPRGTAWLDDELPDVHEAFLAAGAIRSSPLEALPPGIADRALRPDDERFRSTTGRRAALELVLARAAEAQPGLTDVFRAGLEIAACLALPQDVFARPGLAQRVLELAAEANGARPAGPAREELLKLVAQ